MIIYKNQLNTIYLRLTSTTTVVAPVFYHFVFTNATNGLVKNYLLTDISTNIQMYNEFQFLEDPIENPSENGAAGTTGTGTIVQIDFNPGQWYLQVYQSPTNDFADKVPAYNGKPYIHDENIWVEQSITNEIYIIEEPVNKYYIPQ
jgi:hypothetical protein